MAGLIIPLQLAVALICWVALENFLIRKFRKNLNNYLNIKLSELLQLIILLMLGRVKLALCGQVLEKRKLWSMFGRKNMILIRLKMELIFVVQIFLRASLQV